MPEKHRQTEWACRVGELWPTASRLSAPTRPRKCAGRRRAPDPTVGNSRWRRQAAEWI